MNNKIKKVFAATIVGLCTFSALSQTTTVIYQEYNLLNGWNLYATNSGSYSPGQTNNLFTSINGQILYSLTNNIVNGTVNTNIAAGDAFKIGGAKLAYNANGDTPANAAIHILLNNTNFIPISVTNSFGQYFVTNWLLSPSQYPSYMYPATTNTYAALPGINATNNVTFNFQRGWSFSLGNGQAYDVWDTTTNTFSVTYNGAINPGGSLGQQTIITNLPATFTQGANRIRLANITVAANGSSAASAYIINQVSLGQPQP